MMKFPREFTEAWNQPNVRAAFVSDMKPLKHSDCPNCGGAGNLSTFIALSGPFDNPPVGHGTVAHWANGKWWGGSFYAADCPVCNGTGKNPSRVELPRITLRQQLEKTGQIQEVDGDQPATVTTVPLNEPNMDWVK